MTQSPRLQDEWSQSFVAVSDEFWDALLRFATALAPRYRRDEAEDVVQIALVKAIKNYPRFCEHKLGLKAPAEATQRLTSDNKLKAHLRNWLFKIVRHTSYDVHATQIDFVEIDDESLELGETSPTFSTPDDILQFEKQFYKHALDDNWYKRLEALTPKQRTVLFLAAEGYAYRDIADLVGIPIGTVMSNLSRALEKLKK